MRLQAETFENWLMGVLTEMKASDLDLSTFPSASNPRKLGDETTRIKALTEEMDSLDILSNSMRSLTIVHSVKNLGGTRSRPTNKIVALQGLGRETAQMIIDHASAVAANKVTTPNPDKIIECKTVEELEALQISGNGSTRSALDYMSSFFLNPYETEIAMKAKATNCFELILALCNSTSEKSYGMDADDAENEDKSDETLLHSKSLLHFFWAVGKGHISEATKLLLPKSP